MPKRKSREVRVCWNRGFTCYARGSFEKGLEDYFERRKKKEVRVGGRRVTDRRIDRRGWVGKKLRGKAR